MSTLVPVTAESIHHGKALEVLNEELAKLLKDVVGRPNILEKRTVTLKISVKPQADPETGNNFPEIEWAVIQKPIGRSGSGQNALVDRDGQVVVNMDTDVGEDPRQETIPFTQTAAHGEE